MSKKCLVLCGKGPLHTYKCGNWIQEPNLEATGPLTESILRKGNKEEKEAKEAKGRRRREGKGCHYCLVTQICVVAVRGSQKYRILTSEDAWSHCRERDKELSSTGINTLIHSRLLSAMGQVTIFCVVQGGSLNR